jgi:maleylacetoacetate isomerase
VAFKLYTFFRSSAAYRARIALNLKAVDYASVGVHLRRKEHRADDYRELNPQALVPALDHDGVVIPQSLAIVEYLDEIIPQPPLLPSSAADRAIVRSMAQLVASDMHPLCNLRVLVYLKEVLGQTDDQVNAWYRHWIAEGFGSLEVMAARHSANGRTCFGDSITLADICLVPQYFNAQRFDCDLTPYATLQRINAALIEQPAFAAAHPSRQPDAE